MLWAKWFGWGWTPATWQGWAVTIAYVAIIVLLALTIDESSTTKEVMLILILPLIILTALFLRIAYKKGQKPKWQWGMPKEYLDADNNSNGSNEKNIEQGE